MGNRPSTFRRRLHTALKATRAAGIEVGRVTLIVAIGQRFGSAKNLSSPKACERLKFLLHFSSQTLRSDVSMSVARSTPRVAQTLVKENLRKQHGGNGNLGLSH
jgi:hypothetical protein